MLSTRVRNKVEASPLLTKSINYARHGKDWGNFSRTAFEGIARKINQYVTQCVLETPELVSDYLIIGQDEIDSLFFRNKLNSIDDFLQFLKQQAAYRPFTWISGKTLQAYWNNGNPKDKKYNVLLTFIGIPVEEWEEWKQPEMELAALPFDRTNINLLKRHYLGHYFRYYQKSDKSPVLVKTPLIIREDASGGVVVETKTLGHRYRSTYLAMRDGALYIDCENMDWNEKENHIYNIGFETNPEVIIGISNTLNRRKQAIAIKNVLVRQTIPFDYPTMEGCEIPFDTKFENTCEEEKIMQFFVGNECNILQTSYCYSLEELSSIHI